MNEQILQSNKPFNTWFYIRRILNLLVMLILYCLVSFQRQCPTILSKDISKAYNVPIADLDIFSSIYFYAYGTMQLFAGLFADIMEPSYLAGISQIIAAIGSIICGLSNTILIGSIGRFLVGIGTSFTYIPACRMNVNWFGLHWYSFLTGIFMIGSAIGSILAQSVTAFLLDVINWRQIFYLFGGIAFFFSIVTLAFVRGSPSKCGYKEVNVEMEDVIKPRTFKEGIFQLKGNLFIVVKKFEFWKITVAGIMAGGPGTAITGLWLSKYLKDVFDISNKESSYILSVQSIGCIIFALLIPAASSLLKTRKWVMVFIALLSLASAVYAFILNEKMTKISIYVVIFIYGLLGFPSSTLSYPLCRECYHPSVAATAVGTLNFFCMTCNGVFQPLCSKIVKSFGVEENGAYTIKGYKYGLWLVSVVAFSISSGIKLVIHESLLFDKKNKKPETLSTYTEISSISKIDDNCNVPS